MGGDTVVLDGDCTLILPESADCDLDFTFDGEYGLITVVHDIPSNYGLITWNGQYLRVS